MIYKLDNQDRVEIEEKLGKCCYSCFFLNTNKDYKPCDTCQNNSNWESCKKELTKIKQRKKSHEKSLMNAFMEWRRSGRYGQ
jgi:hypothetical protein